MNFRITRNKRSRKMATVGSLVRVGGVVVIALLIIGAITSAYWSHDTVVVTVKDKERVNSGDSSYYLVFTENEVFKNKDSLLYMKFNSSDLYGELDKGETYEFDVYWFRIPFLSMYRNVVDARLCGFNKKGEE